MGVIDTDSRDLNSQADTHPFWYARVLGIYHANVVYTGAASQGDYRPKQLYFLWARNFDVRDKANNAWITRRLDQVRFLPTDNEDAFSFIDPQHVLRSCHIISRFSAGLPDPTGCGVSRLAGDQDDAKAYYVNRFVLRLLQPFHLSDAAQVRR